VIRSDKVVSLRLRSWRIALALLLVPSIGSEASAQPSQSAQQVLESTLRPGATIWLTDSSGQEQRTRIVGVSNGVVTTTAGDAIRNVRVADITRVRVRRSDSVLNGALIGAGSAVAAGLFFCTWMEPWETCRDDAGPIFTIGGIGAGIGIGIDALIRGRRTIYDATHGAARMLVSPMVAREVRGLAVSLLF
jgi:hypothetical protein